MWVTYAPHNWYITLYLRMGVLGLAAVALTMLTAAVRLRRQGRIEALACLAALATFAVPYSLTWQVAPFLAIALAHGARQPTEAAHREAPRPVTRLRARPASSPPRS